jgi:thymidine phosphorylase
VRAGDILLTIYANEESRAAVARERLFAAYRWVEHEVVSPPIVHKVIH